MTQNNRYSTAKSNRTSKSRRSFKAKSPCTPSPTEKNRKRKTKPFSMNPIRRMMMVQNKKKIRMPTFLEGENLKKTTNSSNPQRTKSNPSNFKKFNSTTVSHTKVNGWMEDDKVSVSKFGLIVLSTKVNGKTTKPMDKESFIMLMATYTKVNG
jgi:hypothetical protein